MYKLFQYFFGYRKLTFSTEDKEKIYNFLFCYKIANWNYSSAEDTCSIYISNFDYKYFNSAKRGEDLKIEASHVLGLPEIFNRYKKP